MTIPIAPGALQRVSLTASRGVLPTTVRQALDDYEKALMAIGVRS